jgi:hypothetical protein
MGAERIDGDAVFLRLRHDRHVIDARVVEAQRQVHAGRTAVHGGDRSQMLFQRATSASRRWR